MRRIKYINYRTSRNQRKQNASAKTSQGTNEQPPSTNPPPPSITTVSEDLSTSGEQRVQPSTFRRDDLEQMLSTSGEQRVKPSTCRRGHPQQMASTSGEQRVQPSTFRSDDPQQMASTSGEQRVQPSTFRSDDPQQMPSTSGEQRVKPSISRCGHPPQIQSTSGKPNVQTTTSKRCHPQHIPSTSSNKSTEVVHPPKRCRVQCQPATTVSTRLAKREQTQTVVEPCNVHAQQDPVAVGIIQRRTTERLPTTYCEARLHNNDITEGSNIGGMNFVCQFCGALLFRSEVKDNSSQICCHKGKISLQEIEVPTILKELIEKNDEDTRNYLQNIRQYNSSLAFASLTVNSVDLPSRGPYCFKIHGQVYHSVGSLNVQQGILPSYASLFIIECQEALNLRIGHIANVQCSAHIMESLQNMLGTFNPYAQLFSSMKSMPENVQDIQLHFTLDNAFDRRRYNLPTAHNEIAAAFISTDGAPPGKFDFAVYYKATGQLTRINNLNPHCDPMCYPLLYPCGDSGWKPGMPHVQIHSTTARHTTTQLQYYCYRLAFRPGFNILHSSGKLFQQYIVDCYVKVEGARIAFIRSHQKELRAESYKGLMDFMLSEEQDFLPGIPVILPSTFIGSPRNMIQNYQDAMSIVSRYGKPDLFLTFTCNPKWVEIVSNLQPYDEISNRPDLVIRVFYSKVQLLLDDILKKHVLGIVVAYVLVIEFQKRGLPHAHILLILRESDKIREPEEVDLIVCAEIPDSDAFPRLHKVVSDSMIHGSCGNLNSQAPCMDANKCTKGFPKEFNVKTIMNVNGYPLYRRENNGTTVQKGNCFLDNRWVVPYNPYLSRKYQAHINVEICSTINSVKYLYKYVYKGHDCTVLQFNANQMGNQPHQPTDEPAKFINCRYVSPPEAMWRLHERPLYQKSHTIERLPVHLPEEQFIYFQVNTDPNVNLQKDTKLTAFFKLCEENVTARDLLYSQIPEHFVWKNNEWKVRQKSTKCIGRIYTVNPTDKEKFSLRLLLLHVKGPTSFDYLKTVNGTLHATFTEAATNMNLLENDQEWFQCLEEACTYKMPRQLRNVFAIICVFCSPNDVNQLFDKFKESLAEDYLRTYDQPTSYNLAMLDIQHIFAMHGRSCADFCLPTPTTDNLHLLEIPINCRDEAHKGLTMYGQLNNEQRNIVDEILIAVDQGVNQSFFIDGPGGTGKTFLYQTLIHILRGQGKTVLSVAWTGIAAKLLEDGRTAHSVFKFPVPLLETSVSSIRQNSRQADKIRKASLIIWDEVSMVTKDALSLLDRLLRDLTNSDTIFGGKIIVFGGDFRQILPVVRRGNRTTIVEASVKSSPLWNSVARRKLETNMRAAGDTDFSNWLLKLGDGSLPIVTDVSPESISIPKHCYCSPKDLIKETFGTQLINDNNIEQLFGNAILCTKNEDCGNINEKVVQDLVEGNSRTYLSFDSVQSQDTLDQQIYQVEFLNNINPSGLPPHRLVLKVNTIIMLIRNLNSNQGLVNGTRLIVRQLNEYNIVAKTIDSGEIVIIPRIVLTPSDPTMPFSLSRKQFPIKIAFAMTINKSQGQTLKKAGIFLPRPVFTHGQLYVALSRVKSFINVKVAIEENHPQKLTEDSIITSNIVYTEIL